MALSLLLPLMLLVLLLLLLLLLQASCLGRGLTAEYTGALPGDRLVGGLAAYQTPHNVKSCALTLG
jgi:hypothetical protein